MRKDRHRYGTRRSWRLCVLCSKGKVWEGSGRRDIKSSLYVQSLKRNPGIETCQSLNSIWSHENRPHQTKEYKQLWHLEDRKKRRGNRSNRQSNRCDSKQNDKYFKENGTTEYDDAEKQRTKILHTGLAPCSRHFDKQKSEKGLKWRK